MEHPIYKWMITRGSPISGNLHLVITFLSHSESLQVDDATKKAGYRLVRRTQRRKAVGHQGSMKQFDLESDLD